MKHPGEDYETNFSQSGVGQGAGVGPLADGKKVMDEDSSQEQPGRGKEGRGRMTESERQINLGEDREVRHRSERLSHWSSARKKVRRGRLPT